MPGIAILIRATYTFINRGSSSAYARSVTPSHRETGFSHISFRQSSAATLIARKSAAVNVIFDIMNLSSA
jgi:hypothetical protein